MIKIVTDSTSMINKNDTKKYGITVVPLSINLGEKSFKDGININEQKVTKYNDNHKNVGKSSAPSLGQFINVFKKLTANNNNVLAIMIGTKFSGTYNIALQASKLVKGNITVINSGTTDQNIRHMAITASQMAKSGKYNVKQIVKKLRDVRQHSQLFMGVSTLRNLKANGRIGMVAGFLSELFDLHVIVNLDTEQKLHIIGKGRNKKIFYKWFKKYSNKLSQNIKYIGISYTGDNTFPLYAKQKLQNKFPSIKVICRPTSATVTCHTGTNAFAIMTCDR